MIKKNGIRLTRRTKSIYKGLASAITAYARVQMPPYRKDVGIIYSLCMTVCIQAQKMPECGTIGQNSLSFVDMLKT